LTLDKPASTGSPYARNPRSSVARVDGRRAGLKRSVTRRMRQLDRLPPAGALRFELALRSDPAYEG